MGGYLVCDKCNGYYELQPGELPADFDLTCNFDGCDGELKFSHISTLMMIVRIITIQMNSFYVTYVKQKTLIIQYTAWNVV